MRHPPQIWKIHLFLLMSALAVILCAGQSVWAQAKAEKAFTAVVTDAQGVETEVKHIHFYWEEKVSETAFVPHEIKEVPVKRGTATVKVKFETIKQIDVKPSPDGGLPNMAISLTNGKTGEFALATHGSFRGVSDFGEVELPAKDTRKIVFK